MTQEQFVSKRIRELVTAGHVTIKNGKLAKPNAVERLKSKFKKPGSVIVTKTQQRHSKASARKKKPSTGAMLASIKRDIASLQSEVNTLAIGLPSDPSVQNIQSRVSRLNQVINKDAVSASSHPRVKNGKYVPGPMQRRKREIAAKHDQAQY